MRNKKKAISCIEYLDTGIFPATVALIHNKEWEEAREHFSKQKAFDWFAGIVGDKELFDTTSYFATSRILECSAGKNPDKTLFYIVINEKFKNTHEDYIILAHEVLHLCQFILPYILERDKEIEAEAYLHSHLMRQILNIIAK